MNIKGKLASAVLATLLLAACGGSGLDGTYAGPDSYYSYTFQPNGTVQVNGFGKTLEKHYELDGKTIKIGPRDGPKQVMTLRDDGSISGPRGAKLTKKS